MTFDLSIFYKIYKGGGEEDMDYEIVISPIRYKTLKKHLLKDRTKEQMAIALCGISKTEKGTKFLVKYIILLPDDAFSYQSAGGLKLKSEVQQFILGLAKKECLSQVDFHSHPGSNSNISFSGIDDHHERKLAGYLKKKMPGTFYGSVVVNDKSIKARVWIDEYHQQEIKVIKAGLNNVLDSKTKNLRDNKWERFDRQTRVFGVELQERLKSIRVGIVGLGGFAILTELLGRLGIRDFVLIDNDVIEITNLNRIVTATLEDVKSSTPKVEVAKRNILNIDPETKVTALQKSVFDKEVIEQLKSCDLVIAATDNHSSRLYLNRLCHQYLIPLVHSGLNFDVNKKGKITDISGEFAIIEPGQGWCLQCVSIINSQMASWELASDSEKANLLNRGYIKDVPSPAVCHLNSTVASLACSEIHNFIWPYKKLRKYLSYNLLKSELMEIKVKPNKKCPVCSPEGLLGVGDLEPLPDFNRTTCFPAYLQSRSLDKENLIKFSNKTFNALNVLQSLCKKIINYERTVIKNVKKDWISETLLSYIKGRK